MNKSQSQRKPATPSHNDDLNCLSKDQLDFLNAHGHRTLVDKSFAHYHFVGAPFSGLYAKKVDRKDYQTKVKHKLKARTIKRWKNQKQEDWIEIFRELPEKVVPEEMPVLTYVDLEQLAKRKQLAQKYATMIYKKGCYWCNSKAWGHWGLHTETDWLSCHCRSCQQDFYFRFGYGMNSYNGMMAIFERKKREEIEKLARRDPYLAWLLQSQGIEMNPGPGENTKRDSKRHMPEQRTRMEKLSNKHPDLYKKLRKQAEKLVVGKRQAAQFKQQMEALKPKVQWDIPVTLRLESFEKMFQKFLKTLPPEVSEALKWTDIAAAIYVLFFDTSAPAKWLACRALYALLGIQSTTVAAFSALVFHVLRIIGFTEPQKPVLQAGELTKAISVIMTLALTIMFRQKPSQNRVDVALHALRDLPPTSHGMELVINVFEKAVDYVKSLFIGPNDLTQNMLLIKNRVKFYLSEEGQKAISLNLGSFTELAELQQKAIEIDGELTSASERAAFRVITNHLNSLYRKASLTPIAGHANRKRPVVVHIWGKPAIGKSRIIKLISADVISTILSLDGHQDQDLVDRVGEWQKYVYFSPAGLKYEQNFNAHYSRIYVCDDANQVDPSNKSDGIDFPIKLISLNNSHDHMLPVAELEQKKDARFNSALILATDNVQSPDLSKSVTCKEAYFRRLDISYEMRLKHEYSKEDRIATGEKIRVVDMSTLERGKINTHIYEFYDPVQERIYTYDEFVAKIIALLEHVHMAHHSDVSLFKDHALKKVQHIQERIQKKETESQKKPEEPQPGPSGVSLASSLDDISIYDAETKEVIGQLHNEEIRNREFTKQLKAEKEEEKLEEGRPLTRMEQLEENQKKQQEEMQELNKRYKELLKTSGDRGHIPFQQHNRNVGYREHTPYQRGRGKPKLHSTGISFRVNNEEVDLDEELRNVQAQQETDDWMPFWLASLVIQIRAWNWFTNLKNRIFPPKEPPARRFTRIIIVAAGLFLMAWGANKLFGIWKKNKTKKGRSFINNDNQGYNDGNAKGKKKPPPKKAPPPEFTPARLHRTNLNPPEKLYNLIEYANSANTQVANTGSYAIQKVLCTNAYLIQIIFTRDLDGRRVGAFLRGFFLKGSIFIVNRHLVSISDKEWQTATFNLYNVFNKIYDIPCRDLPVIELRQNGECHHDVVAIDFGRHVKTYPDLTRIFGDGGSFIPHAKLADLERKRCSVFTIMLNMQYGEENEKLVPTGNTAWYAEIQHTYIKHVSGEWMECTGADGEQLYTYDTLEYEMQAVAGYCGSVVIMNDPEYNGKIVGIHMAGYECADTSYAQALTKEMMDHFNLQLQCSSQKFIHTPVKTVLDTSKFFVKGTIPLAVRSVAKSRIFKTPIYGKLIESQKKPAHLGYFEGKHVVNTAMLKYLEPSISTSSETLSLFKALLRSTFSPTRKISEFDLPTAIRGIPGSTYVFPINRSTSPGYPLCQETKKKGKTEYLGQDEEYIVDHPRVIQMVDKYIQDAQNNEDTSAFFVVTAKDELRLIEKVDQGKTRCFAAAPLDLTIVTRMKFLDFAANIMENRISNSSLVGINCYSAEWDQAAHKLLGVAPATSRQFIAGDFTNFDGSLNRNFLWAIYDFIEACYGRSDDLVSRAVWRDLLESKQIFGNAVVQLDRGHPSGHPLTAILNTLYNAGLTYVVLYQILEEIGTVESFSIQEDLINNYAGLYYGDDNCIAFSKALANIIEPEMLPRKMAEFGHKYTTDTKDGSQFKFETLSNVSILKRRFLKEDLIWYAPLELISIMEPLNWDKIKPGQIYEKKQQVATNMRIAIRELSLHPKSVFDHWSKKIHDLALEENIALTPDCYYSQSILRNNLKRGQETPFLFRDDGYLQATLFANTSLEASDMVGEIEWNASEADAESSQKSPGMRIHAGSRQDGSPIEELHPKAPFEVLSDSLGLI